MAEAQAPQVSVLGAGAGVLPATVLESSGSLILTTSLTGGLYDGTPSYRWALVTGSGRVVPFGTGGALYAIVNILEADSPESVRIRCTVTVVGSGGRADRGTTASASAEAAFQVLAATNPPTVRVDTAAQRVVAGGSIRLRTTIRDTAGAVVRVAWMQRYDVDGVTIENGQGFNNASAEEPTWTAPLLVADTEVVLTVTATDDDGRTGSAAVVMTVVPGAFFGIGDLLGPEVAIGDLLVGGMAVGDTIVFG